MKTKKRPTAVFSLNHRTSIFLLQALAEQNVRIPQDMAVVSFDDFDLAAVVTPPLTTVSQSPVEISRRAMALLLERIQHVDDQEISSTAKILLPVKLMIRSSCGSH